MRLFCILVITASLIQGCIPEYEWDNYVVKNSTNSFIMFQEFNGGKVGISGDFKAGEALVVSQRKQHFNCDSVKFIKGTDTLMFVAPYLDVVGYEATKTWNYFNISNWFQEGDHKFVYTLKEEYFDN